MLLHGLLLNSDGLAVTAPPRAPAVSVRTVEVSAPLATPAAPLVTQPLPAPPAAPPRRAPAPRAVSPVAASPLRAEPAPIEIAPSAIVSTAAGPSAPSDPPESRDTVPLYRTVLASPATLHYEMKRGFLSGIGALHWKPAGGTYETRLEGHVAGAHVLTETSTGTLDTHGLAPLRYTDWRARRAISAANFQRDKGKITYSGPQVEHALPAGAQDRVSWMVQIGAVLNAEPHRATPGGRLSFFVSGAQGDADVWTFRYVGTEAVTTRLGPLRAVRFTREPRKTYDRQVDVWLAPEREHLPVRARFTTQANGEVFELLLRDIQSP
ncbi:DUF3108 domain-containing protein [Piscinibacter sp. XHJ-5]|uniref:DUF3108 domain-containing protein n=1 Tax=Piscinibacter sp. XHJ-5 TaxID=3037797 RepID=UPI0024535EE0|nr:DUF3108 domain-containing protein [Piscinibacter sp. XHJ-5]